MSLLTLWLVFAVAAVAVWLAGLRLSVATDVISNRLSLGEDLGGLIFLAIVTNLPETAIILAASFRGDAGIAVGNILGGIAIQTVVLVLLDAIEVPDVPLTHRAASLGLVLEGMMVIAVLSVAIIGSRLSGSLVVLRLTPVGIAIIGLWIAGLVLVRRSRTSLPWQDSGTPADAQPRRQGRSARHRKHELERLEYSSPRLWVTFLGAALVTLLAGVVLEVTSEGIAAAIGLRGAVFGATILAAVTALPEVSTGIASVQLGDYRLAVSDIFGGNAFLPVLFPLATLATGVVILPQASSVDIYLAALGILLTAIYVVGLIFRPKRQFMRLGPDSIVVLVLYVLGIIGLLAVR